jgi:MinD superfamily P-loop ATPase
MRQITIISGKGGTGKTSLTGAFVRLAGRCVAVDADVDAANLALLLPGEDVSWRPFEAGRRSVIDPDRCTMCGACLEVCRFSALREVAYAVASDPIRCEGCGACAQVCGEGAVSFRANRAGSWTTRRTPWGMLVHATLGVAQDSSGKLVAHLRQEGRDLADRHGLGLVLIDGPPGIGCPVHAAIAGAEGVVVVTEPTQAGIHDLVRALQLVDHFERPAGIVLNKADLDAGGARLVHGVASMRRVPILGTVPFDPRLPALLGRRETGLGLDGIRESIVACWVAVQEVFGDGTLVETGPLAHSGVGRPDVERPSRVRRSPDNRRLGAEGTERHDAHTRKRLAGSGDPGRTRVVAPPPYSPPQPARRFTDDLSRSGAPGDSRRRNGILLERRSPLRSRSGLGRRYGTRTKGMWPSDRKRCR